jgi:hypothetical protein
LANTNFLHIQLQKQSGFLENQNERTEEDKNDSQKIEGIIGAIYDADDNERSAFRSKQHGIQSLADEIYRIMQRKGFPEQKNQICSIICIRFRRDKRPWLQWSVLKTLGDEFKRKQDESTIRSLENSSDVPVECSIIEQENLGFLNYLITEFDCLDVAPKGIQRMLDSIYKLGHKLENFADHNGIAYYNPYNEKSITDEINDNADDEFEETISEPSLPISKNELIRKIDDEAFDETINLADDIRTWAKLQRPDPEGKTPSQTLRQAIRWRDSTTAFRLILRQAIDGKARRSMVEWGKIGMNLAEHGGTAASSKSAMPVLNPETGEELVDPNTGRQVFRGITKEQVDARAPRYFSEIDFMVRQFIWTDMVEERFQQLTRGIRDFRAYAARDKLSRKA